MVAKHILQCVESSSWIRRMFEMGAELRKTKGENNIFDFSLGNPCLDPPKELISCWQEHLKNTKKGQFSYTSNAGVLKTRKFLANYLAKKHQLTFDKEDIILCCGAGGGLNVVFHSFLNPQEEIMVSSPYFPEYNFYAKNHSAILKPIPSKKNFQLDLEQIEKKLHKGVKIFLLNSPNNPTGIIYQPEDLINLCQILKKHSQINHSPIYLVSDEPYARILFDNIQDFSLFQYYQNTILVTSFSKDLSLAGERIGYVALHPELENKKQVIDALIFSNRTLGFVNAPASLQFILPKIFHLAVDYQYYWDLRDFLYEELTQIGYRIVKPRGAFYLFPESLEEDDFAFVEKAIDFGILVVPGTGFGCKGHFRISYAVEKEVCYNAVPAFKKLFDYYN